MTAHAPANVNATSPSPRARPPRRNVPTMVQNLGAAGHGWVANGSGVASSQMNDTTDFCMGDRSAYVISTGAGAACQIRKLGGTSVDFTGKQIVLTLKVDDITHLSQVTFYAGSASLANFFRWTIFLRGSSNFYWWRSGEYMHLVLNWQDVSSTSGAPNRAAITDWQVFFTDDNTGNQIKGHVQAVAAEPEPSTLFPNGALTICFDDGYASQFTEGMKKLSSVGLPAVAYVIWDLIGTAGRLTLAQLQQLQNLDGWEIACHSFTQADHDAGFETLTAARVEANLRAIRAALAKNGLHGHDHFAYPMGHWNAATKALTSQMFTSARLIDDNTHETYPPADEQLLRCHTVINTDATAAINTLIDNAKTGHGHLILLFHDIVSAPTQSTQYSVANFGTIVDHAVSAGVTVDTLSGIYARG